MIKPQDKRRFLFSDATGDHFLVIGTDGIAWVPSTASEAQLRTECFFVCGQQNAVDFAAWLFSKHGTTVRPVHGRSMTPV